MDRGIRQAVSVRIIDNSAMLNVNVGSRFRRNPAPTGSDRDYGAMRMTRETPRSRGSEAGIQSPSWRQTICTSPNSQGCGCAR